MWLAFLVIFGAIFVVIAGVLSGGIFTIVLVPLAVISRGCLGRIFGIRLLRKFDGID